MRRQPGAKNIHVWLVEGGKLRANTLKTGKAYLAKMVEEYRSQIIAGGTTSHALARKLHDTLLLPLGSADDFPEMRLK